MAYSLVSPFAGVKNLKLSMSRLELKYSPLSSFIKSLHCTSKRTSNNLWSPSGPLAHPVHQHKTFLLNSSPTHAPPSCASTTQVQDHGLPKSTLILLLLLLKQIPLHGLLMLPGIRRTFLIEPTRPWGNFPGSRLNCSHTSSCSLHVRKTSLLWTCQPSPSHTEHLHCSEPCLITFLRVNAGHSNGLQGEEDKIFKVGIISEGLHIWPPEIAQMTHLDLFLITTHSGNTVKYLPNMFSPDNFFFRKLWHFPDTFAIYYKQVVFPGKYVWALESFYRGPSLSDPHFVLSYKSRVTRLLWAVNSLRLMNGKK